MLAGFARVSILLRALVLSAVAQLERSNPAAMLELEKEALRQRLRDFDNGLAAHAGLAERLMARQRRDRDREHRTLAIIEARVAAGDRQGAARAALELKQLRHGLTELGEQLVDVETTYRSLLGARDGAVANTKARIAEAEAAIRGLRLERAAADLLSLSRGLSFDRTSATFERLREMVEGERLDARGRMRVARERPDRDDAGVAEADQRIFEELALEEFFAGFALPSLDPPSPGNTADPDSHPSMPGG